MLLGDALREGYAAPERRKFSKRFITSLYLQDYLGSLTRVLASRHPVLLLQALLVVIALAVVLAADNTLLDKDESDLVLESAVTTVRTHYGGHQVVHLPLQTLQTLRHLGVHPLLVTGRGSQSLGQSVRSRSLLISRPGPVIRLVLRGSLRLTLAILSSQSEYVGNIIVTRTLAISLHYLTFFLSLISSNVSISSNVPISRTSLPIPARSLPPLCLFLRLSPLLSYLSFIPSFSTSILPCRVSIISSRRIRERKHDDKVVGR